MNGKIKEKTKEQVMLMNNIMPIIGCFSGESDQHSVQQYFELGAFGQKAAVLKSAFKSAARIIQTLMVICFHRKTFVGYAKNDAIA
jgi:hypothetical protein